MARAKIFGFVFVFLSLIAPFVFSQEKSATPPVALEFQLTVADLSKWAMPGSNMPSGMPGTMNSVNNVPGGSQTNDKQIQLNVKWKNTSAKPISAIYWEARFLDVKKQPIVIPYKYDKKIDPGKEKSVDQECKVDLSLLPPEVQVAVRVIKVEFDKDKNNKDKTTWETTAPKDDETSYVSRIYDIGANKKK
jgi:hypothetical protein